MYSIHVFKHFSKRLLPSMGVVIVVVVVVVVVVVLRYIGSELLPLVPLNTANMITEEALVKLFVQNELLLPMMVTLPSEFFLLSRN